jgi:2-hydroxy-3-oxopropionate reductase
MQACAANVLDGLDHEALCRALELLAQHQIAQSPSAPAA